MTNEIWRIELPYDYTAYIIPRGDTYEATIVHPDNNHTTNKTGYKTISSAKTRIHGLKRRIAKAKSKTDALRIVRSLAHKQGPKGVPSVRRNFTIPKSVDDAYKQKAFYKGLTIREYYMAVIMGEVIDIA